MNHRVIRAESRRFDQRLFGEVELAGHPVSDTEVEMRRRNLWRVFRHRSEQPDALLQAALLSLPPCRFSSTHVPAHPPPGSAACTDAHRSASAVGRQQQAIPPVVEKAPEPDA